MIIRTIPERISESTVDIVRLQELCRNSTAGDIENLIELAKQKVLDKFGIELKTEIRILGKKS